VDEIVGCRRPEALRITACRWTEKKSPAGAHRLGDLLEHVGPCIRLTDRTIDLVHHPLEAMPPHIPHCQPPAIKYQNVSKGTNVGTAAAHPSRGSQRGAQPVSRVHKTLG